MKKGYIKRTRKRNNGKFIGYDYEVYERPNEVVATENGKSENGKPNIDFSNLG